MGDVAADLEGTTGWKAGPIADFKIDEAKEGDVRLAFATLGIVDKDGHITDPGAIPSKSVPMSAYGHSSWPEHGARLPVGRGDIAEVGTKGIFDGRFFIDTTHGRDTYLTVKHLGELGEFSYGYKILGAQPTDQKTARGKRVVRLKRLDIFEASPTLIGAGETELIGIKGDDEGPLAGLPFADDFDRVLADVGTIVSRSKSLRELRAKDGRELSESNRARLIRLRDGIQALEETKAELEELLARTERSDPDAKALGLRVFAEYQQTIAGLEGVSVRAG